MKLRILLKNKIKLKRGILREKYQEVPLSNEKEIIDQAQLIFNHKKEMIIVQDIPLVEEESPILKEMLTDERKEIKREDDINHIENGTDTIGTEEDKLIEISNANLNSNPEETLEAKTKAKMNVI